MKRWMIVLVTIMMMLVIVPTASARARLGPDGCYVEAFKPTVTGYSTGTDTLRVEGDVSCPSREWLSTAVCLQHWNPSTSQYENYSCHNSDPTNSGYTDLVFSTSVTAVGYWRTATVGEELCGPSPCDNYWAGEGSNYIALN